MPQSTSPSPSPLPRLVLGHLLALLADATVVVTFTVVLGRHGQFYEKLAISMMGAGLATVSLSAGWLALGPFAFSVRIVAAPTLGLAGTLLATLPLMTLSAAAEAVIGIFLAGIAQFLVLQAPYWLLRRWHRLQIVHRSDLAAGGPIDPLQYSLWQMLLMMTLVAVVLGIGRGVFAVAGVRPAGPEHVAIVLLWFFMLLVAYNLLLAWPLLWGLLSPIGAAWKGAVAGILAALVVAAAYPLVRSILKGEGPEVYWVVFAPQPAILLSHFLATRLAGYRLVRRG